MSPRKTSRKVSRKRKTTRLSLSRRLLRWLRNLIVFLLLLTVLVTLPLRWLNPPTSAYMLRDRYTHDRYVVNVWQPLENIAWQLQLAVVAAEDQRFFEHYGIDIQAIRDAVGDHQPGKKLRGASTISQQLARNLYLWPGDTPRSKWFRKALEAWFTLSLEAVLSKERMLEIYLNVVELGPAIYGAEAASRHYFSQSAGQLNRAQAAALASLLPSPTTYSLFQPHAALSKRREWIKTQMRQLGGKAFLTYE